jgi:hypothetical protein
MIQKSSFEKERKNMIISAAIKVIKDSKEFIVMGKRHNNCLEVMWDCGLRRPYEKVEGFMTDKFDFLDRRTAKQYAIVCGQVKETEHGELFSEDLW